MIGDPMVDQLLNEEVETIPPRSCVKPENRRTPCVMVVDDIQPVRDIVKRILEYKGYNVVGEAEDGDQAIILSRELIPDVIIMDYDMERVNGIEATKAIKKENSNVKVIMMTGFPRPSLVMECMRAGASNFVIKPVDAKQLLHILRKAVGDRG